MHMGNAFKRVAATLGILAGIFLCTYKGFSQSLPFSDTLTGAFPGIDQNFASAHFNFGGNDFAGMLFWTNSTVLPTPELISINGGSQQIQCSVRLNGLYYNNLRGRRLWPLDQANLTKLITQVDANYSSVLFTGGFYTNCTAVAGGYIPMSNDIYGQVNHTYNGNTYSVTAGLDYNFGTNSINGTNFSGSLKIINGISVGYAFDSLGGIAALGETGAGYLGSSCVGLSGTLLSGLNQIRLTCQGNNVNGYTINIYPLGNPTVLTSSVASISSSLYQWDVTLPAGTYSATCTTTPGNFACPTLSNIMVGGGISGGTYSGSMGFYGVRFVGSIPPITRADLNKSYKSATFWIEGLPVPSLATITTGYLYINGTGVGTTGMVNNNDRLNIELISSDKYNTTGSSLITVAGTTGMFTLTTMSTGDARVCHLTTTQKLNIASLFNDLKSSYETEGRFTSLMQITRSMIKDMQDFDYNCNLDYMQQLIDNYIGGDENNHIAPNCKEYPISFNETKQAYTSSKFKKIVFFANREALVRYIDVNNPGDCRVNTYGSYDSYYDNTDINKHIAPNGKMYDIKQSDNGFYSPNFLTAKYFSDIDSLRHYIDVRNPAPLVWNHDVDTDFDPIIYAAPNEKEYKIYKTDQGYMSYKLVKVRYFSSLEEIQSFIDKNNKN